MRIRHRVPTIFNLSMVDVLCCALGCVILLWLLNQRAARDGADAAEHSGQQLSESQLSLDSAERELTAAREALLAGQERERQLGAQVQRQRRDADQIELQARAARQQAAATRQELQQALGQAAQLAGAAQATREQFGAARARADSLAVKLQAAQDNAAALTGQAAAAARQADAANAQWFQATARAQLLERDAARKHQALLASDRKLADALSEKFLLEQTLALRNGELTAEKQKAATLQGQVRQLKLDGDQRFAGMALTGRRVVFLLDMSGSMGKLDYTQPDPKKWPAVCATLGKVMASLPDLEQFQVILFSDDKSYPLGHEGKWLEFRPQVSDRVAVEVLQRTKPGGATNMAAAFQEAFRYRALGLDTIYVLSDGLPNVGGGLPAQADHLGDRERTALCSKYLRDALKTWNGPKTGQPRVRINAIGFYYDSPDVGAFLWVLAREHDGSFVGLSQP